jgi:nuclear pore complex protein Nup98-Nup96
MEEEEAPSVQSDEEMHPWPQQLNLESQRVHVMQTSLFRMPELSRSGLDRNTSYLKHPRPLEVNFEAKKVPIRTSFAQPRTHPPPRKFVRVATEKSVTASREGTYLDAGLSFGRSFRVGWGPGNKMVHVGSFTGSAAS